VYNPRDLVERYVAVWHELAARVLRSHQRWVVDEGMIFRALDDVREHHGAMTFSWEMLPRDGGEIESVGRDVFLLAPDGRIKTAYQFVIQ
jgi:hypothetical protein